MLRFSLFQDGDVWVGVFPQREEIFVRAECPDAGRVGVRALQGSCLHYVGAGETYMRERPREAPYAVQCNGVSLHPGRYSVSLRSDGKIGHATLNQEGQTIGITGVIDRQGRKRGDDALLVEHNGNTRRLSAILVTELALSFDTHLKIEDSANRRVKRVDRFPLTAAAQKREEHRAVPNAQNNQR